MGYWNRFQIFFGFGGTAEDDNEEDEEEDDEDDEDDAMSSASTSLPLRFPAPPLEYKNLTSYENGRPRGAKGELVVLAHDNETLIDIAEVLSLDRNALLDLNRDYIESIRLNSKLHAGTYIRVPDIPRFSSRQQIQPQR